MSTDPMDDVYTTDDNDVLCLDCEMDTCGVAACYQTGHTGSCYPQCENCVMYPSPDCGKVVHDENCGSDTIYIRVGMGCDFDLNGYFYNKGESDGTDATGEGDEAAGPGDEHVL